jgi:hypothetical protein
VTPSPSVLLAFEGSGSQSSEPFVTSGTSVTLAYTYDCSGAGLSGRLDGTRYDRNGVAMTVFGGSARSGADSALYISNTAPPYHIDLSTKMCMVVMHRAEILYRNRLTWRIPPARKPARPLAPLPQDRALVRSMSTPGRPGGVRPAVARRRPDERGSSSRRTAVQLLGP